MSMVVQRVSILALGAAALALPAGPAAAQADRTIVLNIMVECAKIDDPTARLACYDNNIRQVGGTIRNTVPGQTVRGISGGAAPIEGAQGARGFGAEDVEFARPGPAPRPAGQIDEIHPKVASVAPREPGIYRVGMDLGPGTVTLNSVFNYQINFESQALFPQLPLVDYVATTGAGENGLNPNVFEYRALTTLGYAWDAWRASLQWQYYSALEDGGEVLTPGGTPNTAGYPSYNIFHLSGSYQVTEDIGIRAGVDNLFNKAPPLGLYNPNVTAATAATNGVLKGGAFLTGVHDTNGRRFWVGATVRF